ncbi:MAG: aminotransferase [Phycisphaerae bacterium]|nr:aminotransferase [Phycisphaerae bacterium]
MKSSSVQSLVSDAPPIPLEGSGIEFWSLNPETTFLNHGSFGARPRDVSAAQLAIKEQLDADPFDVLVYRGQSLLDQARSRVADLVGCDIDDLVSVINASEAVNSVLRSISPRSDQNIVATCHGYNAVNQTVRHVCDRSGADMRTVVIEPPMPDEAGIVDSIMSHVDRDTCLVMVDHVSSPTAMLFPVKEVIDRCHELDVPVMVDGAHVPGMMPLNVAELGADYYTGNLHKWVSAPLGAAFLHVHPSHQSSIHPIVISHDLGEGYQQEFAWTGTRDPSAFFAVPSAIDWFESRFGWDAVQAHNRDLVSWATGRLCEEWSVEPLDVPESSRATSMRTIALPDTVKGHFDDIEDWRIWLREHHRIDAAVHDWANRWWVRLSAHVYNRPEDYEHLIRNGLAF